GVLIPMPSSKERRKERGWNQAELLAQEMIKHCPHLMLDTKAIIKIKHTVSQTKLSRQQRQENLRNCFQVLENKKKVIIGNHIILIDDVVTTGSSLAEVRNVLLGVGAKDVVAFTIAH
ncbi:MAG: ComF family protein, partial [bacterium]|nr:ComF family protein [bacterium]